MALDFGVLERVPSFGQSFMAGQQAAQAQAERNMLRQAQMQQMAMQQENMAAQREERLASAQERQARQARAAQRQQFLTGAADALAKGGDKLDRPTLMKVLQSGIQADEPSLIQFARETLKALDEEEQFQSEMQRIRGGTPPTLGAAPSIMRQPAAPAPAAPTNMLAGTPFDIGVGAPASANALAAPPAAAPAGITREMAQQMILSTNPRIREQGKALVATLSKDQAPKLSDRLVPVGRLVFDRETRQFITPPAAAIAATQDRGAAAPAGNKLPQLLNLTPEQIQELAKREGMVAEAKRKPAAPADAKPSVTEQQASTATRRLLQRAQEINTAISRSPSAEAPTMKEAAMENIPLLSRATNLVRSEDRQVVSSAQDDVLDALLYLATGAAYNKEQLQQQKSAYIPAWSDKPATREIKRQRLVQMIDNAKVRAGRAWTPELDQALAGLVASPSMRSGQQTAPAAAALPVPAGVDPEDWKYMTPQERSLWQKKP